MKPSTALDGCIVIPNAQIATLAMTFIFVIVIVVLTATLHVNPIAACSIMGAAGTLVSAALRTTARRGAKRHARALRAA